MTTREMAGGRMVLWFGGYLLIIGLSMFLLVCKSVIVTDFTQFNRSLGSVAVFLPNCKVKL